MSCLNEQTKKQTNQTEKQSNQQKTLFLLTVADDPLLSLEFVGRTRTHTHTDTQTHRHTHTQERQTEEEEEDKWEKDQSYKGEVKTAADSPCFSEDNLRSLDSEYWNKILPGLQ